uniref:Uncharacterized protein n=1 Tax=Anopheles culicifacies TaxID=139723 RepID=A0A182ME69_9DIPT
SSSHRFTAQQQSRDIDDGPFPHYVQSLHHHQQQQHPTSPSIEQDATAKQQSSETPDLEEVKHILPVRIPSITLHHATPQHAGSAIATTAEINITDRARTAVPILMPTLAYVGGGGPDVPGYGRHGSEERPAMVRAAESHLHGSHHPNRLTTIQSNRMHHSPDGALFNYPLGEPATGGQHYMQSSMAHLPYGAQARMDTPNVQQQHRHLVPHHLPLHQLDVPEQVAQHHQSYHTQQQQDTYQYGSSPPTTTIAQGGRISTSSGDGPFY